MMLVALGGLSIVVVASDGGQAAVARLRRWGGSEDGEASQNAKTCRESRRSAAKTPTFGDKVCRGEQHSDWDDYAVAFYTVPCDLSSTAGYCTHVSFPRGQVLWPRCVQWCVHTSPTSVCTHCVGVQLRLHDCRLWFK